MERQLSFPREFVFGESLVGVVVDYLHSYYFIIFLLNFLAKVEKIKKGFE